MAELGGLLLGTVVHRPYVVVFLLAFLVAAVTKMGWMRAGLFSTLAFAVALAAEIASTRSGFPLGAHRFVEASRGTELWIADVPLWVPLSFPYLSYFAFQMAILLYSPLEVRRRDIQVLDTIEIRSSLRVLVTAATLLLAITAIIEPLLVRGDRWFIGSVYEIAQEGVYFGVPLSMLGGTFLIALLTIGAYQRLELLMLAPTKLLRSGQAHLAFGGVIEPVLYLVLVTSVGGVTAWIGETILAVVAGLIFAPLGLVYVAHLVAASSRATPAEREAHRRDFPRTRALA